MVIYYKNIQGLQLPVKKHSSDAGFDVFAATDPHIVGESLPNGLYKRIKYIEYGTNLFVKPVSATGVISRIDLRPRSSISNYNLLLANSPATIDESYRGEIMVRFKYVFQPEDYEHFNDAHGFPSFAGKVNKELIYKKGDRIVQLMGGVVTPVQLIPLDELDQTDRGAGGFGSTGA